MPDVTVFVAGTGTDVGKTWVGARLAEELRARGTAVAARKPVQSFTPGDTTDAQVLAQATGESPEEVCPGHRWLGRPLAPPIAARVLGREPFTTAQLAAELRSPKHGTVLVEGVGGPRSPVANDGDNVTLAALLRPDRVVLVSHSGLGAINDVVLGLDAFASFKVDAFLNRFDGDNEVHRTNLEWLLEGATRRVATTIPQLADLVLGSA